MAAIVCELWVAIVADGRLLVVEVGVRVDDLTAFVTLLRILPGKVLKARQHVASMIVKDELRPQLLRHKLLHEGHSRGRSEAFFEREEL